MEEEGNDGGQIGAEKEKEMQTDWMTRDKNKISKGKQMWHF